MRRRVAPFGDPRINGYLLLPEAFRSLSRPSSAPDAKAFPLRSFQLDLLVAKLRSRSVSAGCQPFGLRRRLRPLRLLLAFQPKTQVFGEWGRELRETLWPDLLRVVRESWFSLRIMQALQRLTKLLLPCTLPGAVPQSILLPSRSRKGTSLLPYLLSVTLFSFQGAGP